MANNRNPQLNAALKGGLETIDADASLTFTKYIRLALPLDGFVFWVKSDIVSASAVFNASPPINGAAPFNKGATIKTAAATIEAKGSVHYAANKRQTADGSVTVTRVVFTSETPLHQGIEYAEPMCMYIGIVDGIRFSFSSFKNYYKQADLWHYIGDAIYSDMTSQIIDNVAEFNTRDIVVSNSLPLWLAFGGYIPTRPSYGFACPVRLFPSFLVPSNIIPPYGSVDITETQAIASVPYLGRRESHYQLTTEKVTVTLYGLRNDLAMQFVDCVLQRSMDYNQFGLQNTPIMVDEKQTQVELGVIAMKKSIVFEISYYQRALRDIARQYILYCVPTYNVIPPNFQGLPDPSLGVAPPPFPRQIRGI